MRRSITCYAQPDKPKSQRVLEAFAAGCGGRVVQTSARSLEPGPAAFYGVRPGWAHLWRQAQATARDWYYLDNSWFDAGRERYYRIGVNAVQSWSQKPSDGRRLAALGIGIKPWRPQGEGPVIVCRQSDEYMRTVAGWQGGALAWQEDVLNAMRPHTRRHIVVRVKGASRPLATDLEAAHLLVTHSSAAAVEALIAGVPVIVTDHQCAAAGFSSRFESIDNPVRPEGREPWAARLADSQWTLDELQKGMAWPTLQL